jgi:hypothetical protein
VGGGRWEVGWSLRRARLSWGAEGHGPRGPPRPVVQGPLPKDIRTTGLKDSLGDSGIERFRDSGGGGGESESLGRPLSYRRPGPSAWTTLAAPEPLAYFLRPASTLCWIGVP